MEVPDPGLLREDRSSGAPGDTQASPTRALAAFSSLELMSTGGRQYCPQSELHGSVIGPGCPGCLPSLSEGHGGKEEGLAA